MGAFRLGNGAREELADIFHLKTGARTSIGEVYRLQDGKRVLVYSKGEDTVGSWAVTRTSRFFSGSSRTIYSSQFTRQGSSAPAPSAPYTDTEIISTTPASTRRVYSTTRTTVDVSSNPVARISPPSPPYTGTEEISRRRENVRDTGRVRLTVTYRYYYDEAVPGTVTYRYYYISTSAGYTRYSYRATWKKPTRDGFTQYGIERRVRGSAATTRLQTVASINTLSASLDSSVSASTYQYRIRAENPSAGEYGPWSAWSPA